MAHVMAFGRRPEERSGEAVRTVPAGAPEGPGHGARRADKKAVPEHYRGVRRSRRGDRETQKENYSERQRLLYADESGSLRNVAHT